MTIFFLSAIPAVALEAVGAWLDGTLIVRGAMLGWVLGGAVGTAMALVEGLELRAAVAGFLGWLGVSLLLDVDPVVSRALFMTGGWPSHDLLSVRLGVPAAASMAALNTWQIRSSSVGTPCVLWAVPYAAFGASSFSPLGFDDVAWTLGAAFGLAQLGATRLAAAVVRNERDGEGP